MWLTETGLYTSHIPSIRFSGVDSQRVSIYPANWCSMVSHLNMARTCCISYTLWYNLVSNVVGGLFVTISAGTELVLQISQHFGGSLICHFVFKTYFGRYLTKYCCCMPTAVLVLNREFYSICSVKTKTCILCYKGTTCFRARCPFSMTGP